MGLGQQDFMRKEKWRELQEASRSLCTAIDGGRKEKDEG